MEPSKQNKCQWKDETLRKDLKLVSDEVASWPSWMRLLKAELERASVESANSKSDKSGSKSNTFKVGSFKNERSISFFQKQQF